MAQGGEELKLLGTWASPFVLRAQLALSFKGLSFENIEEDLGNKSDLLITSNPVHKAVPVLLHNGKPVCESLIIVQYVDEAFAAAGPPLLPADPYERATARFWVAFIEDKLLATWYKVFRAKTEEEKAEWTRQTLAAVDVLEGGLKACSNGGSFFGGDNVGYVDIVLGGAVPWVHAAEALSGERLFDAGKVPLLAAWLERFGALNETMAVMPDVERLVEHAKMKQAQAVATGAAAD
jgi:glutathione S-transferase